MAVRSPVARVRDLRTMRWHLAYGEPELHLIPLLADRRRDFVDVGANHGTWSMAARRHFRRIHAFEANPDLADGLRERLGRRHRVHSLALSDQAGSAELWIPRRSGRDVDTRSSLEEGANPTFEQRSVVVPVRSLDSFGLREVALLKIDVEGHELVVLAGARGTIGSVRPVCVVECEERHHAGGPAKAFEFFADLGFEGWFLDHGRLRSVADFDPARHQRPDAAKPLGGGQPADYVNNFVFVHPDRRDAFAAARSAYA